MLRRNWKRAIEIVKKELEDFIKNDKFYYKTIHEIALYLETHKRNEKDPDKDIIETMAACDMIVKALLDNIEANLR